VKGDTCTHRGSMLFSHAYFFFRKIC